jgi:hypothetical protein
MGSKDKGARRAKHIVFGSRNTVEKFGVKITSAQREYYRYTGVSADVERHRISSSLNDFTPLPNNERDKKESR